MRRRPLRSALGTGVLLHPLNEGAGVTVRQGLAAGLAYPLDQRPLPAAPPLRVQEPGPIIALQDAARNRQSPLLVVHPPLWDSGVRDVLDLFNGEHIPSDLAGWP